MDYTEKWRKELPKYLNNIKGELKDFILIGHSMGGYLSSNYTAKYPHLVKRLILLSPIGLLDYPYSHHSQRKVLDGVKSYKFWGLTQMAWQLNVSPFWIGKFLGHRQTYPMIFNYLVES